MLLSLLARGGNCYKTQNSQIKSKPACKSTSVLTNETLTYIRINWNCNHSLLEALGSSSSAFFQRTGTEATQDHIVALGLLDLEENKKGIQGTTFLPQNLGRRSGCVLMQTLMPFYWHPSPEASFASSSSVYTRQGWLELQLFQVAPSLCSLEDSQREGQRDRGKTSNKIVYPD